MSFLRHVGRQGDRKVAIVFREIPGEPHMCLVTYTETLNKVIHDPMMSCIESDIGQNSENLADAMNRSYTADGRPILGVLHTEGLLKKVQTSQVVMTPNSNTQIKLDELNKMLDEMKLGDEAVKKMADMDKRLGMQSPVNLARQMQGQPAALSDADIAKQRLDQATKMEAEANGLLAEATRLKAEAAALNPALAQPEPVKSVKKTKKAVENVT